MSKKPNYKRSMVEFRMRERGEMLRKYYDLFYSKIKIESDDLNEQQKDYLIRQLYYKGSLCILKRLGDEKPLLCPFAPTTYNNEDYPVNVTYINHRGLPGLFPRKMRGINLVDCNLIYIRPSKQSIYSYVEHQVDKIVDISVTLRINTLAQRLPLLVAVDPTDEMKLKKLADDLESGELHIFTGMTELDRVKFGAAPTYNIDKLRAEKEALENELKTQLGINNNNNIKKERMLVDEVNANNDEIESSSNVYLTPLEAACKEIKETLGFDIKIKWEAPLAYNNECQEEEDSKDDDDREL